QSGSEKKTSTRFSRLGKHTVTGGILAFACLDGTYLPKQENEFVHKIVEDLENFLQENDEKSVLLFPPLPSRLRYLIHRAAENYESLSTFSVGEGWSRRSAVCHSELRLPTEDDTEEQTNLNHKHREAREMQRFSNSKPPEKRNSRGWTNKRPDKAIYVPKALRQKVEKESDGIADDRNKMDKPQFDTSENSPSTSEDSFTSGLSAETDGESSTWIKDFPNSSDSNQDTVSDSTDQSVSEQETAVPAHSNSSWMKKYGQTADYFIAMSLDDKQEDHDRRADTASKHAEDSEDDYEGYFLKEITAYLKEADEVSIEHAQCDYSCYGNPRIEPTEFGHVIEIYDFPAVLKTEDILDAFADFSEGGLKIMWVDNTHAMGVFSSETAASQALTIQHPLLKARCLSKATKQSKGKALRRAEFMQPVKLRPRTDTVVAKRMVTRALGLQKRGNRRQMF
ncbi:R3H and coiled-coil domain-containing protein 1, partial [Acipenser ruthenus]|uniref:R3H and coiled-coil domain-containing protein 1 n=1 Tax=Acipenser ruthenus TaxID=7906 RepID=UPI0027405B8D